MERLLPIISHCKNWLTEKIRFKVQRLILSNLLGVLIPFFTVCLITPSLHSYYYTPIRACNPLTSIAMVIWILGIYKKQ